jgi:predicted enzyme related to lactoylglutathione lyase
MGERTKYTPGTFSWADVTTTDQDAAKEFYSGLFGWEAEDVPAGDGIVYSMMRLNGKDVAAISPQQQQQRDAGVPPTWNSYITVDSADAAADKAAQLGATVHAPPFDVFDVGRMAVIQDPQGAFFMVWEPRQSIGAGLVNAPGALSWNELSSPDVDASVSFYGDLFGWEADEFEGTGERYLVVKNDGRGNGGIRELGDQPAPPHWLPYFGIDDIDRGLAKVT